MQFFSSIEAYMPKSMKVRQIITLWNSLLQDAAVIAILYVLQKWLDMVMEEKFNEIC